MRNIYVVLTMYEGLPDDIQAFLTLEGAMNYKKTLEDGKYKCSISEGKVDGIEIYERKIN